MVLKKLKVYHYFWIVALLILILGFFTRNSASNTFAINLYDTYYVIAQRHLAIMLFLGYFLFGSGYWLLQKALGKEPNRYLTSIHCMILFGSFLVYWLVVFYSKVIAKLDFPLFDAFELINQTLLILFLIIVFIGLPVYFINLLVGMFRKRE